jgi:TusA-related sulfurtransferase
MPETKLKFVSGIKPDVTTDIVYMMCPMHLLKLDETIKDMEKGQILELLTDYDGALEDIPQWCEKTGNEFLGVDEEEDYYKFYIRKTTDRLYCPVPGQCREDNICKAEEEEKEGMALPDNN